MDSDTKGAIQIPKSPNIKTISFKVITRTKKPRAKDITIASTGFSKETKYPDIRILNPTIKNDNEKNLKALTE